MRTARVMKVLALVPLGLTAGILLLFTLGEAIAGDWSGIGHLIQALPVAALMWLAWKRPRLGAVLLLALALIAALSYSGPAAGRDAVWPLVVLFSLLLLSAALLLISERVRPTAMNEPHTDLRSHDAG